MAEGRHASIDDQERRWPALGAVLRLVAGLVALAAPNRAGAATESTGGRSSPMHPSPSRPRPWTRRLAAAVAVALVLPLATVLSASSGAGAIPAEDLSLVAWWAEGEIWVANPDGSGRRNLTEDRDEAFWNERVDWLDDHRVFLPASEGWFVADVDTGEIVQIPPHPTDQGLQPRDLAPDGSTVLFGSSSEEKLYTAPTDGSAAPTRLETGSVASYRGIYSPDGSQIAVVEVCCGDYDSFVVPATGSASPTLLSNGADVQSEARAWSTDGTKVLYEAIYQAPGEDNDHNALVVADADGSGGQVVLTRRAQSTDNRFRSLSPDGTMVAFRGQPAEASGYDDFVVPLDGSATPVLLAPQLPGRLAAWAPDGERVVNVDCPASLQCVAYVGAADGTGPATPLDLPLADDIFFDFSPDGQQFAALVEVPSASSPEAVGTAALATPDVDTVYVGALDGSDTPEAISAGTGEAGWASWSSARPAQALFSDVPPTHPFYREIRCLVELEVTGGYADGTFRPSLPVGRQAMAAFLYRLLGDPEFVPPATATFSDVPTTSPFFTAVEWLAASGITGGYPDGTFRPGLSVGRQPMAAFLYRAAGEPPFTPPGTPSFSDVPTTSPFRTAIEWMVDAGITGGFPDGTFKPTLLVSRQAMAAFLCRFADLPVKDT